MGGVKCNRYEDLTLDLKPTRFEGEMKLVAEDAFRFAGVSALQVMDPKTEEVTYYYRGEGAQKNIIVQAVMTKNGGKFRYYYYRPTESEKNPFNLPSMGAADEDDATLYKKKQEVPAEVLEKKELFVPGKNKYSLSFDPRVEKRNKYIPKNIHLAKGELVQEIVDGLTVNAGTNLSVAKGNEASFSLKNDKGRNYVELNIRTAINGVTTHSVAIPYEVRLSRNEKDGNPYSVSGRIEDRTDAQVITLSLVDKYIQQVRTEIMRDKKTDKTYFSVGRDFDMGKNEIASVSVGRDGEKSKFIAFQHKKAIKDNITMVMDVRVDDQKRVSLMYQMRARF